jgi:hypothetical protein
MFGSLDTSYEFSKFHPKLIIEKSPTAPEITLAGPFVVGHRSCVRKRRISKQVSEDT